MNEWLRDAAAAIGADVDLSDDEEALLLDLAAHAAHASGERTNAPLLCYLVGRVQGDRSLGELAEVVQGLGRSTS